jgi:hypothetical protein
VIASYHFSLSKPLVRLAWTFRFRILPCTNPQSKH